MPISHKFDCYEGIKNVDFFCVRNFEDWNPFQHPVSGFPKQDPQGWFLIVNPKVSWLWKLDNLLIKNGNDYPNARFDFQMMYLLILRVCTFKRTFYL